MNIQLSLICVFIGTCSFTQLSAQTFPQTLYQKGYLHLSAFQFLAPEYGRSQRHLQTSLGLRVNKYIGVGIGWASWTQSNSPGKTRVSGIAPHLQVGSRHLLSRLEIGVLTKFSSVDAGSVIEEDLHLANRFRSSFLRIQAGIRFFRIGVVGVSAALVPQAQLTGERRGLLPGVPQLEFIERTISSRDIKLFLGIHLQKR
ncbi:MAG: hypothetical protein AAF587_13535 [Bacteroidota bacterium]